MKRLLLITLGAAALAALGDIAWDHSTAWPHCRYNVYRLEALDGPVTCVATNLNTNFWVTPVLNRTVVYYVTATNALGESEPIHGAVFFKRRPAAPKSATAQ